MPENTPANPGQEQGGGAVPPPPVIRPGRILAGFALLMGAHGLAFATLGGGAPDSTQCRISEVRASGVIVCTTATQAAGKDGTAARSATLTLKAARDDEDDKARLATIKPGAIVARAQFAPADGKAPSVAALREVPAHGSLGVALVLAAIGTMAFLWASVGFGRSTLRQLVVGADNRMSNSKVQATLWLVAVIWAWYAIVIMRLLSGMPWLDALSVTISTDLAVLAGLSATAAAGAKVAASIKGGTIDKTRRASLADLFKDDNGALDAAGTQMLVVTAISVISFVVVVGGMLADLRLVGQIELKAPQAIVSVLFGTSLGAYLLPKITPKPG